jgi:hypothetical protein
MSTSRLAGWTAAVLALASFASPARAAFHLWALNEIYTNSSGTLQFIELHDSFSNENFVNGMQIQVSNVGNTQTHTFVIPGNALPGDTANHSLLFGTAAIQAAGAPVPDYIIPDGFLFPAGGSIAFFGFNGGSYTALPTDGTLSRDWTSGTNGVNSPTNYAGQTGFIIVPEPATCALLACGSLCAFVYRSRRRSRSA